MSLRRRDLLVLLLLLGLALPFLGKPVHIDEANFLRLAEGAALDPWRPHAVTINWQGHQEPAFDVLSNPPGIAWLLAPLHGLPIWAQRLSLLPWLLLAVPAAARLGERAGASGSLAALLIVGSPTGLWATGALTPDLPLFATALAGMAGLLATPPGALGRAWPWALLLGFSACFRYSGLALLPLAPLWALLCGRRREAVLLGAAAGLPIGLLALHDLHAYGRLHLLAMVGFQSVSDTDRDLLRKLAAAVAVLGGAAVLPVLALARPRPALVGGVAGLFLGIAAGRLSGHEGVALLTTVAACACGGATLGGAARARDRLDLLLLCWLGLGLAFLLTLRFTATRYWLPFLAPAALLPLRVAGPRLGRVAVGLTLSLGLLLLVDDLRLARAQERLAAWVLERAAGERGLVAGHWGFQFYLERAGWSSLEEDAVVPDGTLLAVSTAAWPQEPAPGCLSELARQSVLDPWPAPRVLTVDGAANLHASSLSANPPRESYAPWGFGRDPLDTVVLLRGCGEGEPRP